MRQLNNLVSIIIPVYNVKHYLDECIVSIISQTYCNLEIVLVDDGSTDGSDEICDRYSSIDHRVKIIHKQNGGLSSARNAGLDVALGKFVMFIDSDDVVELNMVERLLYYQSLFQVDIVGSEIKRLKNGKLSLMKQFHSDQNNRVFSSNEILRLMLLSKVDCSSCNKLYTRTIIGDSRFKFNRNNEDVLFLYYLYQKCEKVVYTNESFYHYRITPNSITTSNFNMHSFDVMYNAIEMENHAIENGLLLQKEFSIYTSNMAASCFWVIFKNKLKESVPYIYILCKEKMRENWFSLLTNEFYSRKQWLKGQLAIIVSLIY